MNVEEYLTLKVGDLVTDTAYLKEDSRYLAEIIEIKSIKGKHNNVPFFVKTKVLCSDTGREDTYPTYNQVSTVQDLVLINSIDDMMKCHISNMDKKLLQLINRYNF